MIFTENLCDAGVPVALDFLGSFEFFFRQFFQRISAVLLVLNFLGPCAFDFFCRAEDFFGPALAFAPLLADVKSGSSASTGATSVQSYTNPSIEDTNPVKGGCVSHTARVGIAAHLGMTVKKGDSK